MCPSIEDQLLLFSNGKYLLKRSYSFSTPLFTTVSFHTLSKFYQRIPLHIYIYIYRIYVPPLPLGNLFTVSVYHTSSKRRRIYHKGLPTKKRKWGKRKKSALTVWFKDLVGGRFTFCIFFFLLFNPKKKKFNWLSGYLLLNIPLSIAISPRPYSANKKKVKGNTQEGEGDKLCHGLQWIVDPYIYAGFSCFGYTMYHIPYKYSVFAHSNMAIYMAYSVCIRLYTVPSSC